MTKVLFEITRETPQGLVQVDGSVECAPSVRHTVSGKVVVPDPFVVNLSEDDSAPEVEMTPSTDEWVWAFKEKFKGQASGRRFVVVPEASEPAESVKYGNLVEVDPKLYVPIDTVPTVAQAIANAAGARLAKDQNLADVDDVAAARSNLELGSAATQAATAFATAEQGALAASAVQTAALNAAVDAAVTDLVAGAPGALDTLKELADSLGDDPNFAATVAAQIASKANASDVTTLQELVTEGRLSEASQSATIDTASADRLAIMHADVNAAQASSLSLAKSQAKRADATVIAEDWSDTTAWASAVSGGGVVPTVSGGKLVSASSGAGAAWLLLNSLPIGDEAVMDTTIEIPASAGGTGLVFVGVTDSASGEPSSTSTFGLAVYPSDHSYKEWIRSTTTLPVLFPTGQRMPTPLPAGTYNVRVVVDTTGISITLSDSDGVPAALMYTRSFVSGSKPVMATPRRFALLTTDSRGASGIKIGPVNIANRLTRVTPEAKVAADWRLDAEADEQAILISMPQGWDARVPIPLVVHHHGAGQSELDVFNDSASHTVYSALLAAGYGVLSVSGGWTDSGTSNNWGNDAGQALIERAIEYVRERYAVGSILLWGTSMGGLATLNTLMRRKVGGVAGWLGTFPVCDLAAMFAENAGTYASQIRTAYGIASDGSDYAEKTAGHDPATLPGSAFRGVPMRFYASAGDVVTPKSEHSDVLAAIVAQTAPEAEVVECTGGHGDASHFQPSDYVAFFNRCIGKA